MKLIVKNKPQTVHFKLKKIIDDGGDYSNLKNNVSKSDFIRDEVLGALLNEQHGLCAYCMKKITLSDATIEHIIGQKYVDNSGVEIGKENQLVYENFLAVCDGKSCNKNLHCDKSRANYQKTRPLFANPLENRIMQNIKFSNKGVVYYKDSSNKIEDIEKNKDYTLCDEDPNIKYDIQVVLNLNCQNLKEKRESILKALKRYTNNWSNNLKIQKKYDEYSANHNLEFSQFVLYHLKKKL